jgi:hypothetical protein
MITLRSLASARLLASAIVILMPCAVMIGAAFAQAPQGILAPGDAAVAGFSGAQPPESVPPGVDPADQTTIDLNGPSLRVIDLQNMGGPPQAQLVQAPKPYTATAAQIGQVFGVALDKAVPPNIYVAASSAYGLPIVTADGSRLKTGAAGARFMPGLFGPAPQGGPGSIWKIDGATGEATLFANVTLDGAANPGTALGGLAFDAATGSLFVADRGTGMIHRFAPDGREIGRFDHGTQGRPAAKMPPVAYDPAGRLNIADPKFSTENPATWGYAVPERLVFGLGVKGGRLYYAVAGGLQVWSVAIAPDGLGSDPRIEVAVPAAKSATEISKIVFDDQGRMYLSDRPNPTGAYDFEVLTKEGVGRVLRYSPLEGLPHLPPAWQQNPNEYAIGFPLDLRNANGGIDIGYRYTPQGQIDRSSCGGFLWSTGEQLRKSANAALAAQLSKTGALVVDGLQGNALELVRPQNVPPQLTYFIDYDDHAEDELARGHIGDIAIWRVCGPAVRGSLGSGSLGSGSLGSGSLEPSWQTGWYSPPPKFPPNICAPGQQQQGFQCCPSGTSPAANGQCKSWCPNSALDPGSVKFCSLGYDPKGNPDDKASWTCLDGSKPDAQLILDDNTAPYACIDQSPLYSAASCPAGFVKDDLGKIDAKLAGKQSCVKAPEQVNCAEGSQLGLDNQCHQICAMGGIAWPTGQCCASGSVVSVSGKCCPPGSKVDGKSGQCNPPPGCALNNVKVGGSCCPTENVGLQVKLGAKNFVCCPNTPDPNTGYCLPPAVQISACDSKQLTPDKKTCCPVGQKPGDGDDSNKCVCANSMQAPVNGVCQVADACPVGQVLNNVIGGCCPAGSKPAAGTGACTCADGKQPVGGVCPAPLQLVCAPGLVANPAAVGLGDKAKDPCLCPDGSKPPAGGGACPAKGPGGAAQGGGVCTPAGQGSTCCPSMMMPGKNGDCESTCPAGKTGDFDCYYGFDPDTRKNGAPKDQWLCLDGSTPDLAVLKESDPNTLNFACLKQQPSTTWGVCRFGATKQKFGDLKFVQNHPDIYGNLVNVITCWPNAEQQKCLTQGQGLQIGLDGKCQLLCPQKPNTQSAFPNVTCTPPIISISGPTPPQQPSQPLSGCAPGLKKQGNTCVCPSTGKPPAQKPGGGLICDPDDPPVATCTTGFAPSNDGACCRRNLLTAGGQCCTGGFVPGVNRAACVPPGCGPGKHWDFDKKTCLADAVNVPGCGPGKHWDFDKKACLADAVNVPGCGSGTHWDPAKKACVANQPSCRPGSHWDPNRNICATDQPTCYGGTHWDAGKKICVSDKPVAPSCGSGSHWDAGKKTCVSDKPIIPSCRAGSHWDAGQKTCVSDRPSAQRCGSGSHWDAGRRTCVSEGNKPKPKADVEGSKPKPKADAASSKPKPRPNARPFSNRRQRNH